MPWSNQAWASGELVVTARWNLPYPSYLWAGSSRAALGCGGDWLGMLQPRTTRRGMARTRSRSEIGFIGKVTPDIARPAFSSAAVRMLALVNLAESEFARARRRRRSERAVEESSWIMSIPGPVVGRPDSRDPRTV